MTRLAPDWLAALGPRAKNLRPLDEHLHGDPLDVEYGPDWGGPESLGEWSPGAPGWTMGNGPSDGFGKPADSESRAAALTEARRRKADGDRTVYGHALGCGNTFSSCGACVLEAAGLDVQPRAGDALVFSDRQGTILWTGAAPEASPAAPAVVALPELPALGQGTLDFEGAA